MRRIKRWLAPPVFPDDRDKTRRAEVLNILLVTLLALMPVLVVGNLLGGRVPAMVYGVNVGMFVVCLMLRELMSNGRVVAAGWVLLLLGIVGITVSLARLGTVRAPTAAMYLLIIITSGLLTGLSGMVVLIFLCILAIVGLIVAANAGWLPEPDLSVGITQGFTYWRDLHRIALVEQDSSERRTVHAIDASGHLRSERARTGAREAD